MLVDVDVLVDVLVVAIAAVYSTKSHIVESHWGFVLAVVIFAPISAVSRVALVHALAVPG